jgi:hypothetical protein
MISDKELQITDWENYCIPLGLDPQAEMVPSHCAKALLNNWLAAREEANRYQQALINIDCVISDARKDVANYQSKWLNKWYE